MQQDLSVPLFKLSNDDLALYGIYVNHFLLLCDDVMWWFWICRPTVIETSYYQIVDALITTHSTSEKNFTLMLPLWTNLWLVRVHGSTSNVLWPVTQRTLTTHGSTLSYSKLPTTLPMIPQVTKFCLLILVVMHNHTVLITSAIVLLVAPFPHQLLQL